MATVPPTLDEMNELINSCQPDDTTTYYDYLFGCAQNDNAKIFAYTRKMEYLESLKQTNKQIQSITTSEE